MTFNQTPYSFAPTAGSPTIATGANLTAYCSNVLGSGPNYTISLSGLCSDTQYAVSYDQTNHNAAIPGRTTVARPASGAWDMGAYQFVQTYTLTTSTSPSGGGTISLSPVGGVYASGTQVTLTASPASGYVFSGWTGSVTTSTNPLTVTVNSNMTLTANFTSQVSSTSVNTGVVGVGGAGGPYIPGVGLITSSTTASTSLATGTTPASTTVATSSTSLLAALLDLVREVRSLSLQMFFTANADRNLTVNSEGDDVWAFQVYLITNNILTPTGPVASKLTNPTGYFGNLTENALAEYQAQAGIAPASGFLGPKTRAYLQSLAGSSGVSSSSVPSSEPSVASPPVAATSAVSTTQSLSLGDQGPEVTTLQNILVQDNYLSTSTPFVSGTFDAVTQLGVEVFQCFHNIVCSGPGYGTVGPKTRAALGM